MADPLFVSEAKLEELIEKGEVTFVDNILTLVGPGAAYAMAPAAKVLSLLDGRDVAGLLGKVWTIESLLARGAETMNDSIILGETAYQCEPGFVGDRMVKGPALPSPPPLQPKGSREYTIPLTEQLPPPLPKARAPSRKPEAEVPPSAAPAPTSAAPTTDMDLLTDFILKNM